MNKEAEPQQFPTPVGLEALAIFLQLLFTLTTYFHRLSNAFLSYHSVLGIDANLCAVLGSFLAYQRSALNNLHFASPDKASRLVFACLTSFLIGQHLRLSEKRPLIASQLLVGESRFHQSLQARSIKRLGFQKQEVVGWSPSAI